MYSNHLPTRLRKNRQIRNLVKENSLDMDHIIYPVFIVPGKNIKEEIPSMKNQYHYSVDSLIKELDNFKKLGIKNLLLFGNPEGKDEIASSAYSDNGIVQQAIKSIKSYDKDMYVITDVCLCQYKSDGHCCIYDNKGNIDRKNTLDLLGKIALSHVIAGADMVAPSDMMDGRILKIRTVLDNNNFEHIPIMSYSAKYASSFYGPFRDAAHSAPTFGDRKSYQMDFSNTRDALREFQLDEREGADILMVKPAMTYLDIIRLCKENTNLPVAAYQVSGEYAMLLNAVKDGIIDKRAIYESLISIKRSGADIIITYFAKELQELINKEGRN